MLSFVRNFSTEMYSRNWISSGTYLLAALGYLLTVLGYLSSIRRFDLSMVDVYVVNLGA